MQILSFARDGQWVPSISNGRDVFETNAVLEILGHAPVASNRDLLEQHQTGLISLAQAAEDHVDALRDISTVHRFEDLRLGPPIPNPEKIICIGLNYHDHAKEVGATPPHEPIFFAKYANSLAGCNDMIIPPKETKKVDYEAELAVIVGRPGRYIREEDAMGHVVGAMAFNDVSARDLQLANQLWTGGKAIDTFGPCGPAIHTMDEISDLQSLAVSARLNGDVLQQGNTRNMVFSVTYLISFLSRIMTLRPGDIIATGTPAGIAASHDPPRFMSEGDIIEIEIEGLGNTRNQIGRSREE